jgi:hypothetical protein
MNLLLAAVLLMQDKRPESLIEKLGSSNIDEREEASKELKKMGEAIRPELEKAAKSHDDEAARRAREILNSLDGLIAKDRFKKLEYALSSERAVHIKVMTSNRDSIGGNEAKWTATTEVFIKDLDKFRLELIVTGDHAKDLILIASGDRAYAKRFGEVTSSNRTETWSKPPNTLRNMLCFAFIAFPNLTSSTFLVGTPIDNAKTRSSVLESMVNCKDDEDADGVRVLTYCCKRLSDRNETKLWYDPTTYRIRRRTFRITTEQANRESFTEEKYSEWDSQSNIPDEKFKLPEEKK